MKQLFKAILNPNRVDKRCNPPSCLTVRSIQDAKQKAVIGWIAKRIGEKLNLSETEIDSLFYSPFVKQMEEKQSGSDIFHLASLLITWEQDQENVVVKIKDLQLNSNIETCLLNVYTEVREELTDKSLVDQYKPNQSSTKDKDVSDEKTYEIYRDVMYAVTQRKFLLISEDEVQEYMKGNLVLQEEVKQRSDVTKCREKAKEVLEQIGSSSDLMSQLLVISEAVTNILKHAESGYMYLVEEEAEIRVIIKDKGPGFSLKDLPNTVLIPGYSTKKSLGQGFTIMMKMASQVLLSTTQSGSTIILIFNKKGESKSALSNNQ